MEGNGPFLVGVGGHPPSPISSALHIPMCSPRREHEPSGAAPVGKQLRSQGSVGLPANPDSGKDPKALRSRSTDEKSWPSATGGLCRADQGAHTYPNLVSQRQESPQSITWGSCIPQLQPGQAQLPRTPSPRSSRPRSIAADLLQIILILLDTECLPKHEVY